MEDRLQHVGRAAGRASRRSVGGFILLVAASLLGGAQPAHAWRSTLGNAPVGLTTDDFWNAVAQDSSGDLFVAGVRIPPTSYDDCDYVVARLDGATGATIWRHPIPDCNSDETLASAADEVLLIDPAGDVIVGRRSLSGDRSMVVFKYAGATGEVLWAVRVGGFPKHGPYVQATAIDAAGNVLVAGGFGAYTDCGTDLVVAKLDGRSGAELWRHTEQREFVDDDCDDLDASSQATSVAVDPSGDVLALGSLAQGTPSRPRRHGIAMKLSGVDGSQLWRVDSPTRSLYGGSSDVLVYPNGDLAHIGDGFQVIKRSGATGGQIWSYRPAGVQTTATTISELALAPDGTVAAVGWTGASEDTVAIDGASGQERWRAPFASDTPGLSATTHDLTFDGEGNVLASLTIRQGNVEKDLGARKLAAADGSELWRIRRDGAAPDLGDYASPDYRRDRGGQIAERDGRIAVVGSLVARDTFADGIVLALSASGDEIWRAVATRPANDGVVAAALRPGGDVVAAGVFELAGGQGELRVSQLDGTTGDVVWQKTLARGERVGALALGVDPAGDVLAAIDPDDDRLLVLTKRAGAGGAWVWSRSIARNERDRALHVAFAANGDALVAVSRPKRFATGRTLVRRFSGVDGTRRWSRSIGGLDVLGLAVGRDDDVVVQGGGKNYRGRVVKLDGATGAKIWRAENDAGEAIAIDSRGDVLIGGQVLVWPGGTTMAAVSKLDGATGTRLWRELLGGELDYGNGVHLALTPADDVLATAMVDQNSYDPSAPDTPAKPFAARLAGSTGVRTWLREVSVAANDECAVTALASDHDGNMLLGGCMAPFKASPLEAFAISRLAADDGALTWQRAVRGARAEYDSPLPLVRALAVDESGRVVAAGSTTTRESGADFTVFKLNAE